MRTRHRGGTRRRALPLAVVAACSVVVGTAAAVPVTGTLQIPRDLAPQAGAGRDQPASYYWQERNGFLDTQDERVDPQREMAVVLVGETEGDRPDSSIKLWGGDFLPSTVVVQAGSQLHIQNTDACAHELFSDDLAEFAPLQTAPGNARSHPMPADAGHHVIRDRVYPHIVGHLHVVTDLAARASVGADGRFRFEDVPPGTYTLKVYFRENEVGSREIEVVPNRELALDEPVPLTIPASQ
jgi:hypothetical protein